MPLAAAVVVALWALIRVVVVWMARHAITTVVVTKTASEIYDAYGGEAIGALWHDMQRAIGRVVAYHTGLELDDDDPFTTASLSTAISRKSGVPLRNVLDRDMVREDLEAYALDQLASKTGYRLSSLTNAAAMRGDIEQIGAVLLEQRTGIPLAGVMQSGGDVRGAMLEWCTPAVVERIVLQAESSERSQAMSQLRRRTGITSVRILANRVQTGAALLAEASMLRLAEIGPDKVTRRRLQNRINQARHRERHGNRQIYIPLGYSATVTEDVK